MSYRQNSNGPKNYVKKPKTDRPRNARLTFSVFCSGVNKNGFTYDPEACFAILEDLQKNNVYDNINIPVTMSRGLLEGDETRRGQSSIGHVLAFDNVEHEMGIMVYGNFVDKIDKIPDLVIEPRVMVRDGQVTCILSIDVVQVSSDDVAEGEPAADVADDNGDYSPDAEE